MKRIIFLITFTISVFCLSQDIKMGELYFRDSKLRIFIKNTSDKDFIFYPHQSYFVYKIYDSNGNYIMDDWFIAFKDVGYYSFIENYSEKEIKKTMKKYNISEEQAVLFLEYSKEAIVFSKKSTHSFERVYLPIMYLGLDKEKDYYIEGVIYSQTEYFPPRYRKNIEKKNKKILDKIEIPKTLVKGDRKNHF